MKKEILVEAMGFTEYASEKTKGKKWKTIRGQVPKWIREELYQKKRPATTGSSSHSSDDKYAAAAKRQGGH